eukprot:4115688-Amphidinium_carterae.1
MGSQHSPSCEGIPGLCLCVASLMEEGEGFQPDFSVPKEEEEEEASGSSDDDTADKDSKEDKDGKDDKDQQPLDKPNCDRSRSKHGPGYWQRNWDGSARKHR